MYVEINQDYIHKGCRLLSILGKAGGVGGIEYQNRMLQDYVADVETRLAGSMKEVGHRRSMLYFRLLMA